MAKTNIDVAYRSTKTKQEFDEKDREILVCRALSCVNLYVREPGDGHSALCPECRDKADIQIKTAFGSTQKKDAEEMLMNHEAILEEIKNQGPGEIKWVEKDPTGKSQHESGAKLDAGKPRLNLVLGEFSRALMEVGKVGTYGANKYSPNGWKEVENGINRYSDAMLRHYLAEHTHGDLDQDTGLSHAAHLAWNALARLELMMILKNKGVD